MSALRRNILYNTVLSVSQILFPLVTFPYASRVLGPEAMGAVNFADNFTTYFLIFAALGIPLYGIREIAKVRNDKTALSKIFSELMIIHMITSLVAVAILFLISYYTDRLRTNIGLYQIGMSVVMGSVFIAEWFFQGIEKFRYIALRTVSIRALTIFLLFIFVHSPADKDIYYGLNLLAIILSAIFNMYAVSKMVKVSVRGLSFKRHFRPLLVIFSNSIITTIYLVFDTVILGFLTNDTIVGYYSASMKISKLPMVVIGVLSSVLLPRLTLAFRDNDLTAARAILDKSLNFVIFLSIPVALGTYCLSAEIIQLFAGDDYLPATGSLQILCFIVIFVGAAQIFSQQILLPLHQEKRILFASLIGMLVSLALNFMLIPYLGNKGAAISSVVTEFVVTLLLFAFSRKLLRLEFPFIRFMQCVGTCLFFFIFKVLILQITRLPVFVVVFTGGTSMIFYLVMHIFVWKNRDVLQVLSSFRPFKFLEKI